MGVIQDRSSVAPTFDRFGWYWQPAKWLEGMTPQDAITATTQAIELDAMEQQLQSQAKKQEAKAAAVREAQQNMLDSLYEE